MNYGIDPNTMAADETCVYNTLNPSFPRSIEPTPTINHLDPESGEYIRQVQTL